MNVITIESEAFQQIINEISEIKSRLNENEKHAPSTKWLTNNDAVKVLGVTTRTLQKYRDNGEISFSQKGSKIYYSEEDIQKFFLENRNQAFKYKR